MSFKIHLVKLLKNIGFVKKIHDDLSEFQPGDRFYMSCLKRQTDVKIILREQMDEDRWFINYFNDDKGRFNKFHKDGCTETIKDLRTYWKRYDDDYKFGSGSTRSW